MTLQIPFRGVIEIVADHDVGKTIAALQTVYPYNKTIFVDDDVKGDGTVRQMADNEIQFVEYINLGKLRMELGETPTPTQLLNKIVIPTVDKIVKMAPGNKKHEVIIWDTWRIVYQSARGHVERNQADYKDVVTFRGNSQIIQGLISKVARMIEQTQLNKLRSVCDLLIVTHHLKDNYSNSVVVGKIPESSATFSEVSNMRLWLRRNINSKVPVILFLKRPNVPKVVGKKMSFVNIVPPKIVPTADHESIWDAIQEYQDKPIQSRKPNKDEEPTKEEMAMISGTLSDDQKAYALEVLKLQKEETEAISEIVSPETIIEKSDNGNYPKNGVQLIAMAQSSFKYDLPKLQSILGKNFINEYKVEDWDKLVKNFEKENK